MQIEMTRYLPTRYLPVLVLILAIVLAIAGCATPGSDPSVLLEADDAIELAMRVGARDHAPLELDEALDLRRRAAVALEQRGRPSAADLAERATLQARLAITRAEGSRARSELDRKRSDLNLLREQLRREFGEEFSDELESLEPAGGES